MDAKTPMSKYWMPLVWATNIINRARKESLITSDHIVQTLLTELSDIRRRLGSLIGYDTVCVPLVYTQVSGIPKKLLCNSEFYFLTRKQSNIFREITHYTTRSRFSNFIRGNSTTFLELLTFFRLAGANVTVY